MTLINEIKKRAKNNKKALELAKKYKKFLRPLVKYLGIKARDGKKVFNHNLKTIVIVSHEASETGAPILALNLCQELSQQYNIIAILMRGGEIAPEFLKFTTRVLQPRLGLTTTTALLHNINLVCGTRFPEYALVNSIVSAPIIQPLRSCGIPVLTLIHEFSAYIRPADAVRNVTLWSNRLIFSSPLTREDMLKRYFFIEESKTEVLPQGPCKLTHIAKRKTIHVASDNAAWDYLEGVNKDEVLILGAGEIHLEKESIYLLQ